MASKQCACKRTTVYHSYEDMGKADFGLPCLRLEETSGEPFADYFNPDAVADQTALIPFRLPPSPDLKGGPFLRPTNLLNPTDQVVPYGLGDALSNRMQIIDLCTPNTEWGGGYADRNGTYLTVGAQEHAPLELPRYSYAAINTDDLLAEAEDRVMSRFG